MLEVMFVELPLWKLYFNGSSTRSGQGIGVVFLSLWGILTQLGCKVDGKCTHNRAEYEALILGLELALKQGMSILEIYGDSQLVIH